MSKNLRNIVKRILKESELDWFSDMNIDKIKVGAEFESSVYAGTFIIDEIHWKEERPMGSIVNISGIDHKGWEFTNHFFVSDILDWLDDGKIKPIVTTAACIKQVLQHAFFWMWIWDRCFLSVSVYRSASVRRLCQRQRNFR